MNAPLRHRTVTDAARDLANTADRFAEEIHDIDLIADRMRARQEANAAAYWAKREGEAA